MTVVGRVAVAAAIASLALAPAPARADGDQPLGVSRDGIHWSDDVDRPLFDPQVRWVPGDVRTATFWVRNQRSDRGHLTIDLLRTRRDSLIETGWLHVSARTGDGSWTTVSDTGTHRLDTSDLEPGVPLPVEVRVGLDWAAPNGTMVLGTDLDLRATLVDADVVSPGGGTGNGDGDGGVDGTGASGGPGGGGLLPGTGSVVPPWLPPLAVLLIGTGGYLVVRRRREDDDHPATAAVEPILSNGAIALEPGLNGRP
ncbi:LPXTG cell wall anchor domain-containing protein [Nocardioides sp. C4-1]|uniref:LPXTG cell wall anchor domain-containing protein n=1 Tax=Nocardioides sp. C4-1 TaxID=3151851 RepID=UPI003266A273